MTYTALEATKQGMLSPDEVGLIKQCVKMLPQKPVIINIGAGVGTSTLAILEANPKAFIFSIDKVSHAKETKTLAKARPTYLYNVAKILGKSQVVGFNWPHKTHMVFVDGDHTNKGCAGDIEAWLPTLRKGGIMLFHDYNHPNLPNLSPMIDNRMMEYEVVGRARYMIGFRV